MKTKVFQVIYHLISTCFDHVLRLFQDLIKRIRKGEEGK